MIIIAGKNEIAAYGLELVSGIVGKENVVAVCNQNDKGEHSWQPSFKARAKELSIKEMTLSEAEQLKADMFLSLEFDKIVKPEKFNTSRLYNIHFSKLPKYKGMFTSVWPILNSEPDSGVTLHHIESGIDTGDILKQNVFELAPQDRSSDLYNKYLLNSKKLLTDNFKSLLAGQIESRPQPKQGSSYYSKKTIDYSNLAMPTVCTAWELQRHIHAFSFRVYQLPIIAGKRVVEVEILDRKSVKKPGTFFSENESSVEMATIDFDVRLHFDRLAEVLESIKSCSLDKLPALLKNIAGINDRNERGWSPLIVAAYNGNFKVVEELLRLGANPNETNYKRTSALMYAKDHALKSGDKSIFDLLLKAGASLDHKDDSGKTLHQYINSAEAKVLGV